MPIPGGKPRDDFNALARHDARYELAIREDDYSYAWKKNESWRGVGRTRAWNTQPLSPPSLDPMTVLVWRL